MDRSRTNKKIFDDNWNDKGRGYVKQMKEKFTKFNLVENNCLTQRDHTFRLSNSNKVEDPLIFDSKLLHQQKLYW